MRVRGEVRVRSEVRVRGEVRVKRGRGSELGVK